VSVLQNFGSLIQVIKTKDKLLMLNKSRPDSYIYEIQGGKTNGIKLDIEKEYEIGLSIEDMWNLSETEVGLKVNGMNIVMDIRTGEARKWVD
jgi:hypothetical protein